MWFGNLTHAQWVPCPKTGMQRGYEGRSDEIPLDNGGLWIDESAANHALYSMEFPLGNSAGVQGVEAFARFSSKEWGQELLRFIDPMRTTENLFSQDWSAPGALTEQGWKGISATVPTYTNVATNIYDKPIRSATYLLPAGASGVVPTAKYAVFTLLIPPTHQAVFGWSGTLTGGSAAVMRVQPINLDGSLAAVVDVAPSSEASAPAFSNTFSGATYKAIKIYLSLNAAAAGTSAISVNSMWLQCRPIGQAGIISRHIPGKGHMGLKFRNPVRTEDYVSAPTGFLGMPIVLAEVEQWAP